jgi:elongation factor Tu
MTKPRRAKDVEAEITFLTTEEGGRKCPAFSDYRPQFYYDRQDWDAVHTYIGDVEPVYPGQTVMAYLSFLSPQYHVGKLYPGKEFLLREGQRIVGKGRVTEILELEESAKEAEAREAKRRDTTDGAT